MEELTLEQLIKNMCKGKTNYITLVQQEAYHKVINHNAMVNVMKSYIQETREFCKKHPGNITYPSLSYSYYNPKKGKSVRYTIYTKAPRYRTYRQQCAITYNQLESTLKHNLYKKDKSRISDQYFKCSIILRHIENWMDTDQDY